MQREKQLEDDFVIQVDDDNRLEEVELEEMDSFVVNVRFTTGHTLKLNLLNFVEDNVNRKPQQMTVAQLKQRIKHYIETNSETLGDLLSSMKDKHMRLIFHGKLLMDPLPLKFYRVQNEAFIHCTLSDVAPQQASQQHQQQSVATNEDDGLRGFDRLRESGFSGEDVQYIRNEFYNTRQHLLLQYECGQITMRDLQNMEEQWMNEDYDTSSSSRSSNTTQSSSNTSSQTAAAVATDQGSVEPNFFDASNFYAFLGMFLGFYFALACTIMLLERSGSRKFKYGMVAGFACNVAFSVIKFFI